MFKLKKNKMNIFLFIIIVLLVLYFLANIYGYFCKTDTIVYDKEGFNIRQYYNSKRRNLNKLKNKYLYDSKIKIKKFLRQNNII